MFAVALTVMLSASAPVRLAAPAWRAVNVSETEAEFFANHFAQRLSKLGYSVTTRTELAELIGMERQRQLLGCSDADAANCIAELAGALGVDGLIIGNIARFDKGFTIDIRVVNASTGAPLAQENGSASSSDEVLRWLRGAAPKVSKSLHQQLRPGEPELVIVDDASPSPLRPAVLIPAAVGVAAAGVGTFGWFQALSARDAIRTGADFDPENLSDSQTRMAARVENGKRYETLAYIGWGVGAAGIATAIALHFTGVGGDEGLALLPTSNGGALVVHGRF